MKLRLLFLAALFITTQAYGQVALSFDGVDDYIDANSAGPQGSSDRTVECWFKTSNVMSAQQVLVDWGSMSPLGQRFTLNYIYNGLLRIEVGGNGFNSSTAITDGNWHHVAVTYNNSAATKACLYIDGQLDGCNNFTQVVNTTNTMPIQIGRRIDLIKNFMGEIDEVRIWNYARTQSQILNNMNEEFCTIPSGLIAYYKLSEGIPNANNAGLTVATDYAGSNNGTLHNFTLNGSSSNWVSGNSNLIQDLDTSLRISNDTIYSNDTSANSYQWIDCSSSRNIPGETMNYYVPTASGNYAVVLNKGVCADTSTCVPLIILGLENKQPDNNYVLINNLASTGMVSLQINLNDTKTTAHLFSISGQLISSKTITGKGLLNFELDQPNGLYLIKLTNTKGLQKTFKVVSVR